MTLLTKSIWVFQNTLTATLFYQRSFKEAGLKDRLQLIPSAAQLQEHLTSSLSLGTSKRKLPGLLLIDLDATDGSGWNLLEWLRTQPSLAYLPVAAVLSSLSFPDTQRAFELGARAVLTKPLEVVNLAECVERFDRLRP